MLIGEVIATYVGHKLLQILKGIPLKLEKTIKNRFMLFLYSPLAGYGGIVLKKENSTFVFLVIWCILVLTYFTVWKNNWFALISTNMLLLIKLYLDYKHYKK